MNDTMNDYDMLEELEVEEEEDIAEELGSEAVDEAAAAANNQSTQSIQSIATQAAAAMAAAMAAQQLLASASAICGIDLASLSNFAGWPTGNAWPQLSQQQANPTTPEQLMAAAVATAAFLSPNHLVPQDLTVNQSGGGVGGAGNGTVLSAASTPGPINTSQAASHLYLNNSNNTNHSSASTSPLAAPTMVKQVSQSHPFGQVGGSQVLPNAADLLALELANHLSQQQQQQQQQAAGSYQSPHSTNQLTQSNNMGKLPKVEANSLAGSSVAASNFNKQLVAAVHNHLVQVNQNFGHANPLNQTHLTAHHEQRLPGSLLAAAAAAQQQHHLHSNQNTNTNANNMNHNSNLLHHHHHHHNHQQQQPQQQPPSAQSQQPQQQQQQPQQNHHHRHHHLLSGHHHHSSIQTQQQLLATKGFNPMAVVVGSGQQTEILTPTHLRKAKLMFFYVRYPNSSTLKECFRDVRFNKNNTAQLVKWFSNFREFYYIQMEKFARDAVADDRIQCKEDIVVNYDHELINQLNNHYNKNRHIELPEVFRVVVEETLRHFFDAIHNKRDLEQSWKKAIYKLIARLDQEVPEVFKTDAFNEHLE